MTGLVLLVIAQLVVTVGHRQRRLEDARGRGTDAAAAVATATAVGHRRSVAVSIDQTARYVGERVARQAAVGLLLVYRTAVQLRPRAARLHEKTGGGDGCSHRIVAIGRNSTTAVDGDH